MTNRNTCGYVVGSLARDSINRKLAHAVVDCGPDTLHFHEISICDLPLYNRDLDDDFPASAHAFKQAIAGVDGVLFITPEYNRSVPASLKNAIEWASRPWGANSFSGKPTAVIGTSPSRLGTALAQQSLRTILHHCGALQLPAAELCVHFTPALFTDNGAVSDASTAQALHEFTAAFAAFVAATAPASLPASAD